MNALALLSQYCGIVEEFVDAHGATQVIAPDTRQAILAAMGIDSSGEAGAHEALMQQQAREANQGLPPVHVHYRTAGPIDMEIAGAVASKAVSWRIELENGDVRSGIETSPGAHTDRGGRCLRIDEDLPCGYHTLRLESTELSCSLIVTPGRCWLPTGAAGSNKFWGVALQLYLLRSDTNWGIGDYGDLLRLVSALAERGADVVGLNPLHAMFVDDPNQASPYSPASRLLLNVLNIDVARLARSIGAAARVQGESPSFERALAGCRDAPLLDYAAVTALKLPVFRQLFRCCDRQGPIWRDFTRFRATAGPTFEAGCLFLALRSRFAAEYPGNGDWHRWPECYRDARSAAVQCFARESADEVTFQAWLQFVADDQLRLCGVAAREMAIGLYRDLAVGANPGGAETWANPAVVVDGVQVGAPPDVYNPQGQDWGLPPFNPRMLRAEGYKSFIELVRANMRHAGGLRIDHVMALQQLYWVPKGFPPAKGAYVRYPVDDLVGILALESQRNECLVVGEDLGTVPHGFRERMESANILSYRVLLFEKNNEGFIAADEYPPLALAIAGSHDLPTLRGWWQGSDLWLKEKLKLGPAISNGTTAWADRASDREAVVSLLNLHPPAGGEISAQSFVDAAHRFLADARSMVTMVQIDDLTGEVDPVNVPSTSDEYPNWRRRLSVGIDALMNDPRFTEALQEMRMRRGA